MAKFLQSMNDDIYKLLNKEAERRGITVQELVRSVVVPDWLKAQGLR